MRLKRWLTAQLLALTVLLLLNGCSGSPHWEAKLEAPPEMTEGAVMPIRLTVSEKGAPVSGLTVAAELEMARMAHDRMKADFREKGNGVYEAMINLPMDGSWVASITMEGKGVKQQQTIEFQTRKSASPIAATVNGSVITQEDLDFYAIAGSAEAAANGSGAAEAGSRSVLLTQIIRLQAIGLLAKEKGHRPDTREVEALSERARKAEASDAATQERIAAFGADRYRQKQQERLELLSLARQVQAEVEAAIQAEHPQAAAGEIRFQTAKAYEELLVSQMSTLSVAVYK
ncbi:hypothetical protein PAESOLCIP111_04240 [Paenibacillus solanacearum]|uniref:YtkA-like domain-containing protein n=1 Tax=Paenibacillus solanacearum TaxID=2048548 RepID=A0A916NY89_9BACL|nr:FixH family protein [Paenibacillus solanacearum]CAG7641517.1 hypothetical protein PAESOLCIP111_04240 [Paenibacillus solanacearum]